MIKYTNDQQLAITKENSNVIVSAGAGSGKTAVLSERVIHKLKNNININELLILTFTNAAANEMKERIRKKINKEPNLKSQLDYLDSAYITTFDAFALSIVKKYHYVLNVSSNINIVDAGIISIESEKILNEIFDKLYESNDTNFINLINDFCVKDDNVIKTAIQEINKSINLKSNKTEYLNNYINLNFSKEKINEYVDEYLRLIEKDINTIKEILYSLSTTQYNEYYQNVNEILLPLINSKTYENIKKNINVKFPKRPNKSDDLKPLKDELDQLKKSLDSKLSYDSLNDLKDTFNLLKPNVETIINIILKYDDKLKEFKEKNESYEFYDIALMAIKIVKENDDIRYELKQHYKEIMIDEYQDTNDIQEDFIKLIENDNVYMVGDIKQSIYKFRNANPSIFKEKYDSYSINEYGFKIDLLKNFRSRNEVLNSINLIFSLIMDNYLGEAEYEKQHQMEFGNNLYLENKDETQDYDLKILNYEKEDNSFTKEEIEAFIIAKDIKDKLKNNYKVLDNKTKTLKNATYNDFCIIMDRRSAFQTYKKIFEYLEVPLVIHVDEKLTSETDITLINNILNLSIKIYKKEYDIEFRYCFTSIARSYLYEINDNDIFEINKNNDYFKNEIFEKCKNISLHLDTLSILEILNIILNTFNFYEKTILVGNVENSLVRIENLQEIANNLSKLGYTPFMFKDYISNMIKSKSEIVYSINTKVGDNVQLMNIHKSKGLEFPICYYSGYHKSFNVADVQKKFLFDDKYGIIIPYFKEGINQTILKDLLKNKYTIEDISEKIRLFYVSLTRAKEKIIIVTSLDMSDEVPVSNLVDDEIRLKYNSFLKILSSIKSNIKDYIKPVLLEDLNLTKDYIIKKQKDYKTLINSTNETIKTNLIDIKNEIIESKTASKSINKLITKEESKNLEYGTFLHIIFETTDFNNITLEEPYKSIINNFINKINIKDSINIYKEHEFIFEHESIEYKGTIDLIVEYKSEIKIIDYKLKDISDDNYNKQLSVYELYLKQISNKKITKYLYSIIDSKLLELS